MNDIEDLQVERDKQNAEILSNYYKAPDAKGAANNEYLRTNQEK